MDDIPKQELIENDKDEDMISESKKRAREDDDIQPDDEIAVPVPKKPKTSSKRSQDDFIVDDDEEYDSHKDKSSKKSRKTELELDIEVPNVEYIHKQIFGDSDDETLAHFSEDEDSWSDLEDIDTGLVPKAKQDIRKIVAFYRKKSNKGSISDDEVDSRHIIGHKRKRRPVAEMSGPEEELPDSGSKKFGGKITEDQVNAMCVDFVTKMDQAFRDDEDSNRNRKPALKKLNMLEEVKQMLLRTEWHENLINAGVLVAVREWLTPLPDKSLPNLKIRETLLRTMHSFTEVTKEMLKQSKIASVVMFLSKTDPDANVKELAANLVQLWSRTLSTNTDSWKNLSEVEAHRSTAVRLSEEQKRVYSKQAAYGRRIQGSEGEVKKVKGPQWASQPLVSTMDYTKRPESKIDLNQVATKTSSLKKIGLIKP